MPATYTPIRYPGGKTKLYPLLESIIRRNGLQGCAYSEPFAGGAGAAVKLLLKGDVGRILINDYDRAVYCIWKAVLEHPDETCAFVDAAELTVDEWRAHRDVYRRRDQADELELGLSSLYLNRTNRSGILDGGLIGGLGQTGPYKMDARFGRDGLKEKVRRLSDRAADIEVFNMDAEGFVSEVLGARDGAFAYFDPPYVQKGPGLYRSSFDEAKHRSFAETVLSCRFPWVATYDDDELVCSLYGNRVKRMLDIGYSAYRASSGRELLICSASIDAGRAVA